MLSSLFLLYIILNAIIFMIGGPKLTGKSNKWFFKLFRWFFKTVWKTLNNLLNLVVKNLSLSISIIGIVVIIMCLIILLN